MYIDLHHGYRNDTVYIIGAQCVENSTQLDGELSQSEGFVLICREGDWGKIEYGNSAAAMVVCRQLGFLTESNIKMTP